jgi:hypothetical protein
VAQHLVIIRRGVADSRNDFLGHDQHVHGRLGVHVFEGDDEIVLEHDVGGNLPGNDFLE